MTATNATPKDAHQSMLAKLLAKENVRVRFGNYSTAFFEPKTRVLGLPMWNAESKQVSDLLVGHEVGHALFTPIDGIDRFKSRFPGLPFDICNIVEDVRIERLIQCSYPGLVYSFREGYRHFIKNDLFKIRGRDLDSLCFADRLNLHAKIGNLVSIPLSIKEKEIYDAAYAAETYDDVLNICERIIDIIQGEVDNRTKVEVNYVDDKDTSSASDLPSSPSDSPSNGAEESGDGSGDTAEDDGKDTQQNSGAKKDSPAKKKKPQKDADTNSGSASDESRENATTKKNDSANKTAPSSNPDDDKDHGASDDNSFLPEYSDNLSDELTASSQRELDKGLQDLQQKVTRVIVNTPDPKDYMRAVTSLSAVMSERRSGYDYSNIITDPEMIASFKSFKEKTKKHVAVLVKEFERRKAAFQYSRALRSTSGSLDVNRLHSYRYEDQIFKSVTTLADAKNHGMMFFIDYSGSMARVLHLVIEQTLQLVTFCKAVGIPFEVYGFTSKNTNIPQDITDLPGENINFNNVNIFEILNSNVNKNAYDTAVKELYAIAYNLRSHGWYGRVTSAVLFSGSNCEHLGATPLNETVIIAHELVRRFRATHSVQRMNVMFLTDGDPCVMPCYNNRSDKDYRKNTEVWSEGYEMTISGNKIHWLTRAPKMAYPSLIRSLKKSTQSTIIGYFIADSQRIYKSVSIDAIRNVSEKITAWDPAAEIFKKTSSAAKRNGVLPISGGYGHDMFFAFDGRDAFNISDDDFESNVDVDDGFNSHSSQNKLAKEFIKHSNNKKTSRVFLHKFSEMIA